MKAALWFQGSSCPPQERTLTHLPRCVVHHSSPSKSLQMRTQASECPVSSTMPSKDDLGVRKNGHGSSNAPYFPLRSCLCTHCSLCWRCSLSSQPGEFLLVLQVQLRYYFFSKTFPNPLPPQQPLQRRCSPRSELSSSSLLSCLFLKIDFGSVIKLLML